MSARWWAEHNTAAEPRARWLGLFTRQLRLERGRPTALPVSGPRVEGAMRRDSTELRPVLQTAGRLDPGFPLVNEAVGGSVDLFLRLLERRRAPPPWAVGPEDRADGPPDARVPDAEVPLWKRLMYLLQLRTDRLLQGGAIEWPGTLFEYQLEGIRALLSRDALLLADDMGLGKTVMTIAALRILAVQRKLEGSLLIVPASLVSQWRAALRTWGPELRVSAIRGPAVERAWQWTT
ncbi:MAG: hypothetical protein H0V51_05245, partial [Chloroflexi bacterium]|nr:hypothetical protein [Chloroflexota bacterium]